MTGTVIVQQVRSWLGTSYHHQGRLKKAANHKGGVDCIGLIMGVAQELGLKVKSGRLFTDYDRTNYSQQLDKYELQENLRLHFNIVKANEKQAGDIGLFRFSKYPQHVGFISDFINGAQPELGLIHCYSSSELVIEHSFSDIWQRLLVEVYRFPEQ